MPCFVTGDLNRYLDEQEKEEQREKDTDYLAQEEAERIVQSDPTGIQFRNLMEFISDDIGAVNDLEKFIHAVINNASVENIENLQKFMLQMAYKIARENIEKEYKYET